MDHFRHHRHSIGGNSAGQGRRYILWVWARHALVGMTLIALAIALVAAVLWHRQLFEQRLRRHAQAVARQALERLNSHNNRSASNTTTTQPGEMVVSEDVSSTNNINNNYGGTRWKWWNNHNHTTPDNALTCESTLLLVRHCEDLLGTLGKKDGSQQRHCSELGHARARYLASLFGSKQHHHWPLPVRLYALGGNSNSDRRQYETLEPLARKVAKAANNSSGGVLPMRMLDFDAGGTAAQEALAADWFGALLTTATATATANTTQNSLCGQVGVAAWPHAYLPALAHRLGCGPDSGCPVHWTTTATSNAAAGGSSSSDSKKNAAANNDDNPFEFDLAWQLKYVQFVVVQDDEHDENGHEKQPKHHHHQHRNLSHAKGIEEEEPKKRWHVYGTVTRQGFDPLSFRYHRH